MTFDEIQKVVVDTYDDGEHSAISPSVVSQCGDGLLEFLLLELSEKEGCESFQEALDRLDTIQRQINQVRLGLQGKIDASTV